MLYHEEEIFNAIHRNALVLTVNQRMTRTLLDEYQRWQLDRGVSAWIKAQIFTPFQWWRRCLVQRVSSGVLLSQPQQRALWQKIVRADLHQHNYALLQVGATVKQALKAYSALYEHRVPIDDYTAITPEERAFKRWCVAYLEYCDTHNYIDAQHLAFWVQEQFESGNFNAPAEVWLVGFDEISPQLRALTDTLAVMGTTIVDPPMKGNEGNVNVYSCADPDVELQQVARWAYRHISAGRRVGVVVPELERQQASIERIFREYASAERNNSENNVAVSLNLSLGKPLSAYGVIYSALTLLQGRDPLELNTFGYLLRSPWFAGGQNHMDMHAATEAFLRVCSMPRASLKTYISVLEHKGYMGKGVERIANALNDLCNMETAHPPMIWAEIFTSTLEKAGWPGDYAPDSETYQVLQAWEEQILPQFISLTSIEGEIQHRDAVRLLQLLCDESIFQPAAEDKSLQVVGMLEGVALACDVVWVMGLHDQVLPAPLNYNTFIPVQVQKKHAMPRASTRREIDFCSRLMQQFCALAPEVNFSYPRCSEDGNAYVPSPFLPAAGVAQQILELSELSVDSAASGPDLEIIHDTHGIPLDSAPEFESPPYKVKGGTYLLKAQAACPFRAYVSYRMQVRALEIPVEGVDMRVRGSMLHILMQRFWEDVETQAELLRRNHSDIFHLLSCICTEILEDRRNGYVPHSMRTLEQRRLVSLALEWLEIERERSPFRVLSLEERDELQIGVLKVTAFADRVDEITPDGTKVLLDYKTGKVALKDIVGETLLEPQLPAYALFGRHQPVLGLGVAQVRAGECSLKGVICQNDADQDTVEPLKGLNAEEWEELLVYWRDRLEQLASDIVAGCANVSPAQEQVCQFCEMHPLCRIREEPAAVAVAEGEVI